MKITLTDYDLTGLQQHEIDFCGNPAVLIIPEHIGVKFNQSNKIFRSSIWSMDGQLLSAGLPKFTNFGENPEHFPVPLNVDGVQFVTKIDGSLGIIDYVNDKLNMRTRGTSTYLSLENYSDFEYCLDETPKIVEWLKANPNYSLLCEITTPNLRVILNYGDKPKFWLVACINKDDYSLMTQSKLDVLGMQLGISRPDTYTFNTIEECLNVVKTWDGKEGVCLYHGKNQQQITKIKAEIYLRCHRFKSECSLENTLELYLGANQPSYQEFEQLLITQFDYECFNLVRGYASQVSDVKKEVVNLIQKMNDFVSLLKSIPRKNAAIKITSSFGTTGRSGMCFTLLDNKPLTMDQIRKLYWQFLKN